MKLTLRQYSILMFFQLGLLLVDLFFNSFRNYLTANNLKLSIFLFVIQDVFIVCEFLLYTVAVHSTCVFEVGASMIIYKNCKLFLCSILLYFLLSVAHHTWIVYFAVWTPTDAWPSALTVLIFLHRVVSVPYYYSLKRTALVITDPRYHEENIDWISDQLSDK